MSAKLLPKVWIISRNNHIKHNTLYFGKEVFNMKKVFKLVDLDCANCAQKMEDAINRLPGVTAATVSFMTQKLTIEADDIDAVMKDVIKCCKKVEPDCEIVL